MMWLEIEYSPTTLFSLKSSLATNSAGKSLFCPSPYSVKMALLNSIITYESIKAANTNFNMIRDLDLQFYLPEKFVVNNCLIKIHKPKRNDQEIKEKKKELKECGISNEDIKRLVKKIDADNPFQPTIAFREYLFFNGNLKIGVNIDKIEKNKIDLLIKWFFHINYFGKKGCFFQLIDSSFSRELPEDCYSTILGDKIVPGLLTVMDDIDSTAKFENVDNYDSTKAKRVQKVYHLPFRQVRATKDFHFYTRIGVG